MNKRKKILLYTLAPILLIAILIFFNRAYSKLNDYSNLTSRHNAVHIAFQNLSKQINNAAVLNPELMEAGNALKAGNLFFADSSSVIRQLNILKSLVRDSLNIQVVERLEPAIRSELSWLLVSNVPDSLLHNRAPGHIASFRRIDSLIGQGIKRTTYLIGYREQQLNDEIIRIRTLMIIFILLSGVLLIIATTNFFRQQSKRERKEEELLKTLKEVTDYKFALDESSIIAITDQKGIIQHANENFCKISKYSREELIGQDHRIINSGHHPKEFIKNLWVTIANGKIWKGELKNKAKDGTIYWVDTTIVPFLNEENKPYQYVAIRADITERKLAEENLAQSLKETEDYKYALEESSIVAITDQKGIISYANDNFCRISKYSREELIGQDHRIINSGHHPKEFIKDLWVTIANGKIWKGELKNKAKDGSIYWVDTTIVPFLDEKGKPYQYVAIRADITERKKGEDRIVDLNRSLEEKITQRTMQLKKSNEEMEAFSYSVSHDLRAPLRGALAFANILDEEYGNKLDEEARRIISVIKDSTLKMGNLIDDLLAFSRLGKQSVNKVQVDTGIMVKEIIQEMVQQTNRKHIAWKIQELPQVMADISMLRQVWINLISNAVKYSGTREKPVIEIGSYPAEGQLVFYIKDNGVGFDEAFKDKLFKVFQRLHDTDEFEGTGVGLALVEKIVTRHDGRVWAEGKEGEGACFYFSVAN